MLFAAVALVTSCSETSGEEDEYADWQQRNEAYFNSVYAKAKQAVDSGDKSWKLVRAYTKNPSSAKPTDFIVVEVLNTSSDTVRILYSDSVDYHYQGRMMPTQKHTDGYLFDKTWTGTYNLNTMTPYTGQVSGFVVGFTTALMNMHRGDRWKVYIPSGLAYGSADRSSIPAYSTLVFDLTVSDIRRNGKYLK